MEAFGVEIMQITDFKKTTIISYYSNKILLDLPEPLFSGIMLSDYCFVTMWYFSSTKD